MSEEEMKVLVELNNMLKHENEKLKQEKEELSEILREQEMEDLAFLNNITVYDEDDILEMCKDDFSYQIKERGKVYYEEGRIEGLYKSGDKYFAQINGNGFEPYNVTINFNYEDVEYSCDCPYEFPCKHEYAVLIAISNKEYQEVELKAKIKEKVETIQAIIEKIPAEELKEYFLSKCGLDNAVVNIPSFYSYFRKYLPNQSYEYYYNNLYNSIMIDEDYEFLSNKYLTIINQYLIGQNYQESFKIIKAIINAYHDSNILNFSDKIIDDLLKMGMYLRIIVRKSDDLTISDINNWKEELSSNNYYNNIYLEDMVLSAIKEII